MRPGREYLSDRYVSLVPKTQLILPRRHDFRRFRKPRELMAYLGLVPSEHSSGDRTNRGGITKSRTVTLGAFWSKVHGTTVTRLAAVPLFASAAKANPHA